MNPKLTLNRASLIHNLRVLKKQTSSAFICPMVKANAYGVGDTLVVNSLLSAGVKFFGVARVFEAEKLRRHFPNDSFDILVFHPVLKTEVEACIQNQITLVLSSFRDFQVLESFSKESLKQLKPVHIKFDLGMNRLGFDLSDQSEIQAQLTKLQLQVNGVCGHFSNAADFDTSSSVSAVMLKELIKTARSFNLGEEQVHAPNSDSLSRSTFKVGIRPGLSLYGLSKPKIGLEGALTLTAPLVSIKTAVAGSSVSYSGLWTAPKNEKIGILPIGYADGLRRGLSGRVSFVNNQQDHAQIGAICMDYCMVHLESQREYTVGEDFVLFDESSKSLYNWSELLGTIPYEILTGLGNRIERRVT